jgi:hypothetical protein
MGRFSRFTAICIAMLITTLLTMLFSVIFVDATSSHSEVHNYFAGGVLVHNKETPQQQTDNLAAEQPRGLAADMETDIIDPKQVVINRMRKNMRIAKENAILPRRSTFNMDIMFSKSGLGYNPAYIDRVTYQERYAAALQEAADFVNGAREHTNMAPNFLFDMIPEMSPIAVVENAYQLSYHARDLARNYARTGSTQEAVKRTIDEDRSIVSSQFRTRYSELSDKQYFRQIIGMEIKMRQEIIKQMADLIGVPKEIVREAYFGAVWRMERRESTLRVSQLEKATRRLVNKYPDQPVSYRQMIDLLMIRFRGEGGMRQDEPAYREHLENFFSGTEKVDTYPERLGSEQDIHQREGYAGDVGIDFMKVIATMEARDPGYVHVQFLRDALFTSLAELEYKKLTGQKDTIQMAQVTRKSLDNMIGKPLGSRKTYQRTGNLMSTVDWDAPGARERYFDIFKQEMSVNPEFALAAKMTYEYYRDNGMLRTGKVRFIDTAQYGTLNMFSEGAIHAFDPSIQTQSILMYSSLPVMNGGGLLTPPRNLGGYFVEVFAKPGEFKSWNKGDSLNTMEPNDKMRTYYFMDQMLVLEATKKGVRQQSSPPQQGSSSP